VGEKRGVRGRKGQDKRGGGGRLVDKGKKGEVEEKGKERRGRGRRKD